jgi:hypothetical protein
MNSQLLLTFTTESEFESIIDKIMDCYELKDNVIFVLLNKKNPSECFCTYNVIKKNYSEIPDNTISIHRKKETNTLYTINAVNQIILDEVGVYDNTFQINWNEYRNSLLLTNDYGIRIVPTKIHSIVKFD